MKQLQVIGLIACVAFLASCASDETASNTNRKGRAEQTQRRIAEQQATQQGQVDEGQQNLWNAQRDTLNRDGNPMRY
jgi:hypothetical protein